jgi:glycosyltransferase involved in cell wall biosynthesis
MHRVIYAWNYLEWGGAQIHILALIKEARKAFEVVVLLPEGYDPQFLRFLDAEGVQYRTFRGHADLARHSTIRGKLRRHWLKIKSEYHMLRAIEKAGVADSLVHVDLLPNQSLFAIAWLAMRTDVFITSHNAMPAVQWWRRLLWKLKFRAVSHFDTFHVFCSNEDARRYFSRLYSRRVAGEIRLTYTSVNPDEIDEALLAPFDRVDQLESLGLPADRFIVLALGQFVDRKGRWTFLEAARFVARAKRNIVFVWVAPNLPNAAELARIEEYDLGDSFQLVESLRVGSDRKDILRFLRVADIFALPSYIEGLPIALLEAMAMGIPCISTNVNGIPEAVVNGKTGILVDAGDAVAVAEAILTLEGDPVSRHQIGAVGREFVIEKFDERDAARTALASYREAAARHR